MKEHHPTNCVPRRVVLRLLGFASLLHVASASAASDPAITFGAWKDGTWKTYLWREGQPPRPILSDPGIQEGGCFDAGRSRLPVVVDRRKLVVVDLEGNPLHQLDLGHGDFAHPAWFGETRLVVTAYDTQATGETSRFVRIDLSSGKVETLLQQSGVVDYASISTDSRHLVYSVGHTVGLRRAGVHVVQQLWSMNLQTGAAGQVLLSNAHDIHPSWAPDGSKIAFASDKGGQFDIWIANPDGGGAVAITKGAGAKRWPRWSPDGKRLIYSNALAGAQQIWTVDVGGANQRALKPFGDDSAIALRDPCW